MKIDGLKLIVLLNIIILFLSACSTTTNTTTIADADDHGISGLIFNQELNKGYLSFDTNVIDENGSIVETYLLCSDSEGKVIFSFTSEDGLSKNGISEDARFSYLNQNYYLNCQLIAEYKDTNRNLKTLLLDEYSVTTGTWENILPYGDIYDPRLEDDVIHFKIEIQSPDYHVRNVFIKLLNENNQTLALIETEESINISRKYTDVQFTNLKGNINYKIVVSVEYTTHNYLDTKVIDVYEFSTQ